MKITYFTYIMLYNSWMPYSFEWEHYVYHIYILQLQFLCGKQLLAALISSAILWTPFVTPRAILAQQDQTMHLSYYVGSSSTWYRLSILNIEYQTVIDCQLEVSL